MLNQLKDVFSVWWQAMLESHRQRLAMRELMCLDNQTLRDLGLQRGNFGSAMLYGRYETALPELMVKPSVKTPDSPLSYTLKHS
ncbi:hypothetical protein [Beggiatoa leptomitoformis]|uniref:DUF1127 domain-containing protein n=1 Tax=Beggiatoa leptomitoformis TaxID=288004 RepID=A0A2N9YEE3_9GAMM|nr:hypothetical protein [Beggiatoa leptomitoformis]ALG68820.1 hypothetical protein AL038_15345 [Beggiatoa leptomitoformis]AUI68816.1 hypothetical protein BLE401_08915 [Beggiatoa leptomitoformis]